MEAYYVIRNKKEYFFNSKTKGWNKIFVWSKHVFSSRKAAANYKTKNGTIWRVAYWARFVLENEEVERRLASRMKEA